jgi:hypothetical protein
MKAFLPDPRTQTDPKGPSYFQFALRLVLEVASFNVNIYQEKYKSRKNY